MKRYLFALIAVLLSAYACSSSNDNIDPDPDPEDVAIASHTPGTGEGTFSLPVISMDITLPGENASFVIPVIFNGTGVNAGTCYSVEPTYIFGDVEHYYFYKAKNSATTAVEHFIAFAASYESEDGNIDGVTLGLGGDSGAIWHSLMTLQNGVEQAVDIEFYAEYSTTYIPGIATGEGQRIRLVAHVSGGKKGDVIHLEIPDEGAISLRTLAIN